MYVYMRNTNRQQVKKLKHPLGQTKRKTTGKNMKGTNCESTKVSQKVKEKLCPSFQVAKLLKAHE